MTERLTLKEAARRYHRDASTLRRAAERGTLEAEKIGEGARGIWITTVDAMERHIRAHGRKTTENDDT